MVDLCVKVKAVINVYAILL